MLKIVMAFNQYNHGFSEVWYVPDSDPTAWLNALNTTFYNTAMAFRSRSCFLYSVRASVVNAPKNSSLTLANIPGPITSGSTDYNRPDVVSTSCAVRLFAANGKSRFLSLRGLRDGDVLLDPATGAGQPSAAIQSQIGSYFTSWRNKNAIILSTQRPPSGGVVSTFVSIVEPNNFHANWTDLTVQADVVPHLTLPVPLTFLGVPKDDLPGFPNRTQMVGFSSTGGIKYTIPYRMRSQSFPWFPARLQVMAYVPLASQINDYQIYRFTERKTGRPFASLRGRSRAVVRQQ